MEAEIFFEVEEKAFFVEPPHKGASPEEWNNWMKADAKKAAAAKAARTKATEHTSDRPEWLFGIDADIAVKRNGKWTQGVLVGFAGEEGSVEIERVDFRPLPDVQVDAAREFAASEEMRNKRGGTKQGKSARRRANKRRKKAARK